MWFLVLGTLVFLPPAWWAMKRAKRELMAHGAVSLPTFWTAFCAYVGHAVITLWAAWQGAWPMPIPNGVAYPLGGLLSAAGALLYLLARVQFRSFKLTWGLATDRLVTAGVYRFTRHPQVVGSLMFLAGAAFLGKSASASSLVALPLFGALFWVPFEESLLERKFQSDYRQYCVRVPRVLGFRFRARSSSGEEE